VTVNVVSPIAYSPAMTAAIEADPLMGKGFSRQIPLGRVGDPENEVGAGVAMLLGPHARYVTGQTLGIDGGQFTSQ
jgi:NAD(P)-dependent dehydrogenase (short-subunit alcohol dehydrogenase family)